MKPLRQEWEHYQKITKPEEDVRLRVHQGWHAGAVAMYQLMLDALKEPDQDMRMALIRSLGYDAGDALMSNVPLPSLKRAMDDLLEQHSAGLR